MKNFVFISPNFPENYYMFTQCLKDNGFRVLGIGDQEYGSLTYEQKNSMHEYYKVGSLENYDEVFRAVAYFSYQYGHIDYLESNNEYWLEKDAMLRTDFNITTGFQNDDMPRIKYKSKMKPYYEKAGIPVARFHLTDTYENCKAFTDEVGYPVIVKPDNGVGASCTYKLHDDTELKQFMDEKDERLYIMEEFIDGTICSYDAIIDEEGEPVFETGNITPISIMDIVNDADDCKYLIVKELKDDIRTAGRNAVKSFGVRSRFIHFEFFRLNADQHIGKKGEIVALEVNMRPSGGFTPDMINYAHNTNVYKIYADVMAFNRNTMPQGEDRYCAFVGRRDCNTYKMSDEEVFSLYHDNMRMEGRLPDVIAEAMGNRYYMAVFDTEEEVNDFFNKVLERGE